MSDNPRTVCIGYEPREQAAYTVARQTVRKHSSLQANDVLPIVLEEVIDAGIYKRRTEHRPVSEGSKTFRLFDVISEHPMSTEFAISRFLTPEITRRSFRRSPGKYGWAVFMDCDEMVRQSMEPLFEQLEANPDKALFCVKHNHQPVGTVKMDNQVQSQYNRKNWSSFMAFNLDHEANKALTIDLINTVPGRDLHRFCWLEDDNLIGELDPKWNWLVGHSSPDINPAVVHFTEGGPWFENYQSVSYAGEWNKQLIYG